MSDAGIQGTAAERISNAACYLLVVSRNLSGAVAALFLVLGLVLAAVLLSTPLFGFLPGAGGGGGGLMPGDGGGGEGMGGEGGGEGQDGEGGSGEGSGEDGDGTGDGEGEEGSGDSDEGLGEGAPGGQLLARCEVGSTSDVEARDRLLAQCWNTTVQPPPGRTVEPSRTEDLKVVFGREPVPGDRLPVLVVDEDGLVRDAEVRFNGRRVGVTNRYGVVRALVPYSSSLRVTARRNGTWQEPSETSASGKLSPETLVYRGETEPVLAGHSNSTSTELGLETDIKVNFTRPPIPGQNTSVKAHIDGVPVRRGYIRINEDYSGRTDTNGVYEFRVPEDDGLSVLVWRGAAHGNASVDFDNLINVTADEPLAPDSTAIVHVELWNRSLEGANVSVDNRSVGRTGPAGNISFAVSYRDNVSVVAERYGLRGNETLDVLSRIDVDVEGTAFPGRTLVVHASLANESLENASVNVSGRRMGTTDGNGSLAFEMPLRGSVDVVVSKGEARGRASAGWPVLAYLLVALGVASLMYTVVRRRHGLVSAARSNASSFVGFLMELTLEIMVLLADRFARFTEALPRLAAAALIFVERLLKGCVGVLLWLGGLMYMAVRSPLVFLRRLAGWLRRMGRRVVGGWRWLRRHGIRGLFWIAVDWIRPESRDEEERPAAEVGVGSYERLDVEEAWRRLAAWVDGDGMTAAEVRDRALNRGFPSDPVEELTRVFRDVRYGERPETGERRRRAVDALERLGGGG